MIFIKYKISVILPVYNVEKYLKRALDSILNQTFDISQIQVILVDDASTDNSRNIIKEYVNRYDNFIGIYHEKNSGSGGEPRNSALAKVDADYIMFLDPDDEFEKDFCEVMYEKITTTGVDLVKCNFFDVVNGIKKPNRYFSSDIDELIIKSSEIPLKYIKIWNGIHKTSVIKDNNLKFNQSIGEDFAFTIEEFILIDSMLYLNNYFGYKYYTNEEISHARTATVDKFNKTLESYYFAYDIVDKYDRRDIIPVVFGQQIIGLYFRILNMNASRKEKIKLLKEIYKLNQLLDSNLEIPIPIYSLAHRLLSKKLYNLTYCYLNVIKKYRNFKN